jgi:hypothetical protein
LQKALIGLLLNFDQVRNLDGALNLRKIQALAFAHPVTMIVAVTIRIAIFMSHSVLPRDISLAGSNYSPHP